jgi:O-antigen/teichoic acid export membrane protein
MALHRYDVSTAIGSIQGVVRSAGLVGLVLLGFGVTGLVVWELVVIGAGLLVYVAAARRLLPGVRCFPSMSLSGLREIISYSVFSFTTHVFLIIYRESGRLLLGNRVGTESVAHFGTPDSIAQRIHLVVINAVETLVPRFSGRIESRSEKALLIGATWAAFLCVGAVYVPLAVLMPDFLRLWISPDFAQQSGVGGRLITLGMIGSAAFAPMATLFRGRGQPGFVTAVMAATALTVLGSGIALVPVSGVEGAAFAYLLGNVTWVGGLCLGWVRLYPERPLPELARFVGLPLLLAIGVGYAGHRVLSLVGEVGWIGLLAVGGGMSVIGVAAIVGADALLGGASPAKAILGRVLKEIGFERLLTRFKWGRT